MSNTPLIDKIGAGRVKVREQAIRNLICAPGKPAIDVEIKHIKAKYVLMGFEQMKSLNVELRFVDCGIVQMRRDLVSIYGVPVLEVRVSDFFEIIYEDN